MCIQLGAHSYNNWVHRLYLYEIKLTLFINIYVTDITVAQGIESIISTEVCYLNVALKREPYCTLLFQNLS